MSRLLQYEVKVRLGKIEESQLSARLINIGHLEI